MDTELRTFLDDLYRLSVAHDEAQPDRLRRRRNLEPEAATLLWVILQAMGATKVVEVGTSNGYSTLWLADAVRRQGGKVVSIDLDAEAQREAATNLTGAGLAPWVELRLGDGGDLLGAWPDATLDVLFLDSERPEYPRWWPHPSRVLRPGGLLAVDNVLSHPDEVAPLLALVEADPTLASTIVPVGKGELLAVKSLA